MDGWRCPGCGRCYAPTIPQCLFCGPGAVRQGIGLAGTTGSGMGGYCYRCGAQYPFGGIHDCLYTKSSLTFGGDDSSGLVVNSDNQILVTNPADGSGVVLHTEG